MTAMTTMAVRGVGPRRLAQGALAALAALALLAGCQSSSTAIEVTFEITGPRAAEGESIDVVLSCEDEGAEPAAWSYLLDGLGEGQAATLAIEPASSALCTLVLGAQLRGPEVGGIAWPLASARRTVAFERGAVTQATVLLDTGGCSGDVDGDGEAAGGACDPPSDCDDLDETAALGAEELCDGVDNDCDGAVDELAPFGDRGCPEDGTLLIVTFELAGEDAEKATAIGLAYGCPEWGEARREVLELAGLGEEAPAFAIHPEGGQACAFELRAQALEAADEDGIRWPLASAALEAVFSVGEIREVTLLLDTDECSDLDGDLRAVGASAGDLCEDPLRDCDDLDADAARGLPEQCNGRDDNCDGAVDERPDHGPWCEVGETFALVTFRLGGEHLGASEEIEYRTGIEWTDASAERVALPVDEPNRDPENLTLSISYDGAHPLERIFLAQLLGSDRDVDGLSWPLASAARRYVFEPDRVVAVEVRLDTEACSDADEDGGKAGPRSACPGDLDCDDIDGAVRIGAREVCDGRDSNCDGVVDNLSDEWIAESCGQWNPNFGLCQLDGVRPRCDGEELACPAWLVSQSDNCDLYLDTTCDGVVSGCGCDLDRVTCPLCHAAVCLDDDNAGCEPSWEEDFGMIRSLEVGAPCHPGDLPHCLGEIFCDAVSGHLVCEAANEGLEVCNDNGGIDEDCDGTRNDDEPECLELLGLDLSCTSLVLSRQGPGGVTVPVPSPCTRGYTTEGCFLDYDSPGGNPVDGEGGEGDDGPSGDDDVTTMVPIEIRLALPAGVSVAVIDQSCCFCHVTVTRDPAGGHAVIAVDTSGGPLFTEDYGLLELELNLYAASTDGTGAAVLEGVVLEVPIVEEVGSAIDENECTARCGGPLRG